MIQIYHRVFFCKGLFWFIFTHEKHNEIKGYGASGDSRQLNDLGNKILNESGIKEIVEGKKADLLTKVKALNPTNAYDAEQAALDVVREIPKHYPEIVEALKTGAFKVGQGTETVLLVGGFHLRDLIFPDLGFSLTDLDKPKPSIWPFHQVVGLG